MRRNARSNQQWLFVAAVLALLAVWGVLEIVKPKSFIGPDGAVIGYVDELDPSSDTFRTASYEQAGKPNGPEPSTSELPITSLTAIAATDARDTLLGREARLERVRVTEVTSDTTFFVRPEDGTLQRNLFVALEDPHAGAIEPDGRIGIVGTFRAVPPEIPPEWALDPEEIRILEAERVYLGATRVWSAAAP